ncbi:MAG TPA: hypothetical protein DDZ21_06755 [Gammaproteobacteria bacterium]|nr:hypothetical protein [Gammaproteobacteria bacterium]
MADATRYLPLITFMRLYPGFTCWRTDCCWRVSRHSLFAPKVWFANLGIELVDELGYTELKAMYIGLMGTLTLNSLLGAVRERFLDPALDLCLLSYAALASVRAWEILVEGIFDSFTLQLLYAELASAAAIAVALIIRLKSST